MDVSRETEARRADLIACVLERVFPGLLPSTPAASEHPAGIEMAPTPVTATEAARRMSAASMQIRDAHRTTGLGWPA